MIYFDGKEFKDPDELYLYGWRSTYAQAYTHFPRIKVIKRGDVLILERVDKK